jgi:hypothetical protein
LASGSFRKQSNLIYRDNIHVYVKLNSNLDITSFYESLSSRDSKVQAVI